MIKTVLIDRRNVELIPRVAAAVQSAKFVGLDCETHDDARHEGLNLIGKYDDETRHKGASGKLVFDMRRITMCGFSVYPKDGDTAWYFNLNHADVDNRLTWDEVRCVIEALPEDGFWLCHNAPFEITVFASCFGYMLKRVICTMQMSVTAFGDDNYDKMEFAQSDLRGISKLVVPTYMAALKGQMRLTQALDDEDDDGPTYKFNREVDELIGKITSKTSRAAHSYNGFIKEIAYGHGLKSLVQKLFGHKMMTFDDTLGEEPHMGELTGDEVAQYGAEDAYWVVPLFDSLMGHIALNSPDALETFFIQENPMIDVYSDFWVGGMKVNFDAIASRREIERMQFANLLRSLRAALRGCGDFATPPNAELARRQPWYEKNYARYRSLLKAWISLDDHEDDYEECMRVSNAVGNAWGSEKHDPRADAKGRLSITHYMPMRTLIYDLMEGKLQFDMGELKSDGEARAKLKSWFEGQEQNERTASCIQALECMTAMAGVEQRMKLYLTPYVLLTDPETQRLYPVVNCLLNSRRMAASNPNPMQLAKRGESTYVRGFFLPDHDDHLQVSLDWSAFELVIIGELSGDEEFHKAFGQVPHEDLHAGAAADVLRVEMPWMTEDIFKSLRRFDSASDFNKEYDLSEKETHRLFTNLKGESLEPQKARGYWRTEIGKGANFNYWYSGFLTTVGQRMGWNLQTTGTATEFYRNRFWGGEQWRLDTIQHAQAYGWVQLPDGHRRFRYEATEEWAQLFRAKWPDDKELGPVVSEIIRRIQRRAQNQAVNSMVQGTNAFIMKRSILRLRRRLLEMGWTDREARMLIPIHDEMVWSVRFDLIPEFIRVAREVMCDHPDVFKNLKLDATPAVGLTFEPWHPKKAPFGQIELFEPPAEVVGKQLANTRLNNDGIRLVTDYLMDRKEKLAA